MPLEKNHIASWVAVKLSRSRDHKTFKDLFDYKLGSNFFSIKKPTGPTLHCLTAFKGSPWMLNRYYLFKETKYPFFVTMPSLSYCPLFFCRYTDTILYSWGLFYKFIYGHLLLIWLKISYYLMLLTEYIVLLFLSILITMIFLDSIIIWCCPLVDTNLAAICLAFIVNQLTFFSSLIKVNIKSPETCRSSTNKSTLGYRRGKNGIDLYRRDCLCWDIAASLVKSICMHLPVSLATTISFLLINLIFWMYLDCDIVL